MGVRFTFLLVLSYSFFIYRFNRVSAVGQNFRIIMDETKVEKWAVKRATQKPGIAIRFTRNALRRLTICGSEPLKKIEFCRQFLPMSDLGLKFDNRYGEELNCGPKTFHIRHPRNEEPDNYTIDMYSCPDIFYTDLGTELDSHINHTYHVSNGLEYNSAVIFIQRNRDYDEKIYPRYYVKDIVYKKLIPSPQYGHSPLETPLPEKSPDSSFAESQAVAYDRARKLNKPYEKFRRTFFSLNLCGLRKSHKVHLCRNSIRVFYKWYAQLQYEDYDEHACRKRRIRIAIPDNDGIIESGKVHMSVETDNILLLCPQIMSELDSDDDFVYLSSTLLARSVFYFTRKNERGEPFVRKFLVDKLNVERITQDQRRARFMLYPTEKEREEELRELRTNSLQNWGELVDSVDSSVRMPTVIAKFGPTLSRRSLMLRKMIRINRRKQLVEDTLISFAQVKMTNLVYRRFKMTHWSLDICQQPKIVRRQLCNNILTQHPYDYVGNIQEENIDYRCNRRSVHLRVREIESLQPMQFSMWHCPEPKSSTPYNFFIAKNHIKNSALVLKTTRLNSDAKIYPDAVVTSIDRIYLSSIKEPER